MIRTLCLVALVVSAAALLLPATANPLAQIKEAANQGRDAAEEHSEKVAEEAEHAAGHHDHDHGEHGEHAAHEAREEADHAAADHDDDDNEVEINHAVATMFPTEGNTARGVIRFEQTRLGVTVTAEVSGLTPNQKHGFHIHEFGDLSDPAGKATGGHYNPEGHDHVLPNGAPHAGHAGDLGNLQADEQGNATFAMTFDNISIFEDDHNPIIGRGVIIHAQPDDGGQPTGNAGARIAQGVIGVAK